jgi:hypothetical protein
VFPHAVSPWTHGETQAQLKVLKTMSLTRPHLWLAALMAVLSLADQARAQGYGGNFATDARDLPSSGAVFHARFNPFIEPDTFGDPDLQFFAPADVSDYGGIDPPSTGFYFTYDRLYINVDRPDGIASQGDGNNGDFGWGNRIDAGYWSEDHVGWGISASHLDGPNENLITFQERVSRFNEDDDPPGSGEEPILQDRNPRRYNVTQSINNATFSSFELNRMWRRKQFHNGAVLEPFVGGRFMTFKDYGRRDTYHRYAEDIVGDEVIPTDPRREGPYEDYLQDHTWHENSMVAGQLGVRLHKKSGHWLLSGEFRAFAAANFQYYSHKFERTLTRGPLEDEPELEIHEEFLDQDYNEEFVWGGEVRAEASYQLTRDISFRTGLMVTSLGKGIARGVVERDSILDFPRRITINDQAATLAGLTFGIEINR